MENEQIERLRRLADRLLERLEKQLEEGEPDSAAIRQICTVMKDIRDIQQLQSREPEGVSVVLDPELESYSS